MKKKATARDWLPLAKTAKMPGQPPTGEAFKPEWIDFKRGIRVGNIEPHERITQILKYHLERRYGTPFVTDRWGRGVYWQWICWLPKANRLAKPLSHDVNFGCAKLYITADTSPRVFKAGLQVERSYAKGPETYPGCLLKKDWDWHRLLAQCRAGSALDDELQRLIRREGFVAEIGDWEANTIYTRRNFRSASQLREVLRKYPVNEWVGFQLYYPLTERELRACSGYELVQAMVGALTEVVPTMNLCMQVRLEAGDSGPRFRFN